MSDFKPRAAYSCDERRVADYLIERAPDIGAGKDPIGFIIAAHAFLAGENLQLKHDIERQMTIANQTVNENESLRNRLNLAMRMLDEYVDNAEMVRRINELRSAE